MNYTRGNSSYSSSSSNASRCIFWNYHKRSLSSSMTMKTMMGFADLEWISMEWYMPGSRKKRNHFVEYKNKTGWKVYSSPVVAWKGRGGNISVEHCSGVAYLVFVDLYFIFCIMRGVLREKVKKKTTAAQIIAKVLLATNMSSKSDKFNLQVCKKGWKQWTHQLVLIEIKSLLKRHLVVNTHLRGSVHTHPKFSTSNDTIN